MLKLIQHPDGPGIDDKRQSFNGYAELADYADENLPHGLYYVRNSSGGLLTGLREVRHQVGSFEVEGRGSV